MTPDTFTINETMLEVGNGHRLYVHEWGNPVAKEVIVFLHGGPGAGCSDKHKEWFDGTRQRVIFHDQRGCGKSTPYGSLEHNTTAELVADIDAIADHFQLDTFVLNGGSWGSCLALAYGVTHPERVSAMVLRGIFTGTVREADWLYKGGFAAYFPDVWDNYLQRTPPEHRTDLSAYHIPRALHGTPEEQKASAYAYENLEYSLIRLDDRLHEPDFETYDPASIRIEIHYLSQACFMPDNHIIDNAGKLTMPIWLVQGRFDSICTPRVAYELNKALPDSQLIWTIAGHSSNDRANYDAQKILLARLT